MSLNRFSNKSEPLWQDKDVRFDVNTSELKFRTGEKTIEVLANVEDTKGNPSEEGKFIVTNLRLIWQSKIKPRINLSIGYGCISSVTSRTIHFKLRGKHDAVYIMTKVNGTRYEFIFSQLEQNNQTSEVGHSSMLVELISKVCRAYNASRLFRELKLRSSIISSNGKQLKILQSEQIYNKISGVWNLSSDQGNLGVMHLTNVRVVWHANMNELFNISLPYIQISYIKVRESKFGIALVIESTESSGGYVLGFRIDPPDRLSNVYNELINLYNIHSSNPDLGVENYLDLPNTPVLNELNRNQLTNSVNELIEIDDKGETSNHDAIAAYLADDSTNNDNEVVYCRELGLAVEKIKEGFTLESLWNVIPQG